MELLIQFIAVGIIFFIVSYFTWWYTERQHTPEFLNYRPFSCRLCATFWILTGIYVAIGISFKLWVVLIAGCILAGLNAIAMKVHQKNNTIKIEDI